MGQNESAIPAGAGRVPPPVAANPPVPQLQLNQSAASPPVARNDTNRPEKAKENKKKKPKEKGKEDISDDKNAEVAVPDNAPDGVEEEPASPLLDDGHEEPIVPDSTAKAESSESGTSIKSDKSKSGRHGSWDYVPVMCAAAYPKGKPTSRALREVMSLSMDMVDQAPITMGRQARNAKIRRPEPESPVVKAKKAKKSSKKSGEKKKGATKHHKAVDRCASSSRSSVVESDGDSDTSEEFGTSYNDYINDVNENNISARSHSHLSDTVDQPRERRAYISTYSTPSPIQSSFAELPEDILEPEQDAVPPPFNSVQFNSRSPVVKPVPITYLAMVMKRLPTGQELAGVETSFDDHGVLYKPRLLCIPSIPEATSMMELMENALGSDHLYLIPTLRPSIFKKGHVALMFATKEEADSMLHNKAKLVVNGLTLNVEQPGAVLVRVSNESAVGEMDLQNLIKRTYYELILDMKRTPFGTLLLLPSMQQARDLIKAGRAGDLIFSAPRDELGGELTFDWPSIDSKWAEELGLKQ